MKGLSLSMIKNFWKNIKEKIPLRSVCNLWNIFRTHTYVYRIWIWQSIKVFLFCFCFVFVILVSIKIARNDLQLSLSIELYNLFEKHLSFTNCFFISCFITYFFCLFYQVRFIWSICFSLGISYLVKQMILVCYNYYYLGKDVLVSTPIFSLVRILSKEEIFNHVLNTFDRCKVPYHFRPRIYEFLMENLQEYIPLYSKGSVSGDKAIEQIISEKVFEFWELVLAPETPNPEDISSPNSWFYYFIVGCRIAAVLYLLFSIFTKNPGPENESFIHNTQFRSYFSLHTNPLPLHNTVVGFDFTHKYKIPQQTYGIDIPFDITLPPNTGRGLNFDMWTVFGIRKFTQLLARYSWLEPGMFGEHFEPHLGQLRLSPYDTIIIRAYLRHLDSLPPDFPNAADVLIQGFRLIEERIIARHFIQDPRLPEAPNHQMYNEIFVEFRPIQEFIGDNTLFEFHDTRYNFLAYL